MSDKTQQEVDELRRRVERFEERTEERRQQWNNFGWILTIIGGAGSVILCIGSQAESWNLWYAAHTVNLPEESTQISFFWAAIGFYACLALTAVGILTTYATKRQW